MYYRGKSNKYNRKKVDHDGHRFDSKLERAIYQILKLREDSGEIEDLVCQHTIVLQDGSRKERITWRIDFSWRNPENGKREFAEAKGFDTDVYRIKLKLFRARPHGRLEIWKGTHARPFLHEVIEEKGE